MSDALFFVIMAGVLAVGFIAGRWSLIPVAIVLWGIELGVAALLGSFHGTSEDSSWGLFVFAAWASAWWVLALVAGTAVRRFRLRLRRVLPPGRASATER